MDRQKHKHVFREVSGQKDHDIPLKVFCEVPSDSGRGPYNPPENGNTTLSTQESRVPAWLQVQFSVYRQHLLHLHFSTALLQLLHFPAESCSLQGNTMAFKFVPKNLTVKTAQ